MNDSFVFNQQCFSDEKNICHLIVVNGLFKTIVLVMYEISCGDDYFKIK